MYKPPAGTDGERLSSATLGTWQTHDGARYGASETGYTRPASGGTVGYGSFIAAKSREEVGGQRIPSPLPAVATTG